MINLKNHLNKFLFYSFHEKLVLKVVEDLELWKSGKNYSRQWEQHNQRNRQKSELHVITAGVGGMKHASWRLVWGQILGGLGSQAKDTGVHSLDNRNSIKVFGMKNNMISAAHTHKRTNLRA